MDRDMSAGGRGGARGIVSRDKNDPGGRTKSSGPAPKFVKNVPNFLQQYSHLLSTNKKNYMGEELGKEDQDAPTVDEVRSAGGVVVGGDSEDVNNDGDDNDDLPVVVMQHSEEPHDVFREKAPGIDGIAVVVEAEPTDAVAKPNNFKKIEFNKPAAQKRKLTNEEGGSENTEQGIKRTYKSSKKAALLSFDDTEDN